MDACIATDQRTVVHCESVGITRIGFKIRRLQHTTGSGIVLDESRPVIGVVFGIVTNDLPDGAIVPGDRMIARLVRRLIERNHEFRFPRGRIDAKNPVQPERGDPQFAILPKRAVAATSVIRGAEWNLAMAYLLEFMST